MTLADYSLSNVTFDQVDRWKDTLKQLVTSCNQTEALGAMIPQLEEFIDVARSELVCSCFEICCNSWSVRFMCVVDIRQVLETFTPDLSCILDSKQKKAKNQLFICTLGPGKSNKSKCFLIILSRKIILMSTFTHSKGPGRQWTVKASSFVVSYLWLHETLSKVKSSQVWVFLLFQSLG